MVSTKAKLAHKAIVRTAENTLSMTLPSRHWEISVCASNGTWATHFRWFKCLFASSLCDCVPIPIFSPGLASKCQSVLSSFASVFLLGCHVSFANDICLINFVQNGFHRSQHWCAFPAVAPLTNFSFEMLIANHILCANQLHKQCLSLCNVQKSGPNL